MKLRHISLLAIALFIFMIRMVPALFRGAPAKPAAPPPAPERVRITQFYAASPAIGLGDKTKLCYGVENAKTLALTPPVEQVWPALTRCFDVAPSRTTSYMLTADDGQGKSVSETAKIEVGPPRPKLVDISVNKLEVAPGEQVVVCFKARNATKYEARGLKPISVSGPEHGCFADNPRKTTNYLVRVTGPGGEDSEKITVRVK